MIAVLIILALMSVPLTFIGTRTFVRLREIKMRNQGGLDGELLRAQVRELTERIEVLETIATSDTHHNRQLVEPALEPVLKIEAERPHYALADRS